MTKPQAKVTTTLDMICYGIRRRGKLYEPVRVELFKDGTKTEMPIHEPVIFLAVAFEYLSSAVLAHYQQITTGKEKAL